MKVKATFANGKFGFSGGIRRRDGDVFEIESPDLFSKKWMISLEQAPNKKRSPGGKAETDEDTQGAE